MEPAAASDLAVVIVTYNNAAIIDECLHSLTTAAAGLATEIVVVDNASADDTVARVRRGYPEVAVIANDRNAGFAVAVNQGLRATTAGAVVLLNSDVIVNREAVRGLAAACRDRPDRLYSPLVVNPDGTLQETSFGCFPSFGVLAVEFLLPYALARRLGLTTMFGNRKAGGALRYDWLSGACLALAREALERIGPLDERFFMYFEDIDFCLRAAGLDIPCRLLQDVSVLHIGGQSFSYDMGSYDRTSYVNKSLLAYLAKHEPWPRRLVLRGLHALGGALRRLRAVAGPQRG
jgi:GT2 family glycosyltransferase